MRYKISLTSVYSRLKSRHISPLKEGKASYITADQLQLMSDPNTHLKNGGKVADFISARIESGEIASEPPIPASTEAIALAQPQNEALVAPEVSDGEPIWESDLVVYGYTNEVLGEHPLTWGNRGVIGIEPRYVPNSARRV